METESQKYYSKKDVAEEYDDERFLSAGGKLFDQYEKSVVISYLPKSNIGKKLLDAGSGSGRFTIEIAKRGYNVVSADYSQAMLDVIKHKIEDEKYNKNIQLSKQDITKLSFPDNMFDYICCLRVMVNLDSKENEKKALGELIRVCKPGGTIVVEFVNSKSFENLIGKKESNISMKEVKQLIKSYENVKLKKAFGSRIVSQTAYEKSPSLMLNIVDIIDKSLSSLFPYLCVRTYYVLEKF